MKSIENTFSDNEGNHLMVALDFYDEAYKQNTLQIPEEYSDIDIVDISIEKVFVDKPIHYSEFFKMCTWLLQQFSIYDNAVFTYICSFDELKTNHLDIEPQFYRWSLFDRLFQRTSSYIQLNTQDVIVGSDGYQSYGRAFFRDKHAPIIHIITSHLQDKQRSI